MFQSLIARSPGEFLLFFFGSFNHPALFILQPIVYNGTIRRRRLCVYHLGILPGLYDPIHSGHMEIAQTALEQLNLSGLVMVPINKAETRTIASLAQRQHMVQHTISAHPDFSLFTPSFFSSRISTCDYGTLVKDVKYRFSGSRLWLIIGAHEIDSLLLGNIRAFQDINIVLWPRVGDRVNEAIQKCKARGLSAVALYPRKIRPDTHTVRLRFRHMIADEGALHPNVVRYIADTGLYLPGSEKSLQKVVTTSRFNHSLSVRKTAVELAFIHQINPFKCSVAGLMHDYAKNMPLKEMQHIAIGQKLTSDKKTLRSGALLHGLVGAHLCKRKFAIRDEEVLNAIRYHTVGRPGMSGVELCIFVADMIEPGRRSFDGLNEIQKVARQSLKEAAILCLKSTRRYILASGGEYSTQSLDALESLTNMPIQ